MARRESMSAAELREEQLRQIREAKQQDVINKAKSTGVSSAGQPVVGWADSRTPTVTGNSGVQGGTGPTNDLKWANTFKNSQTGVTTSPSAARSLANRDPGQFDAATNAQADRLLGDQSQPQSITQGILNEISANPFSGSFNNFGIRSGQNGEPGYANVATPSIATLAQGGQNHAQRWQENALRGFQRVSPFVAGGTQSYTDYGPVQPGTRRPYIGGAGDMTKRFADRNDPSLDPFSFASAFR